MDIYENIKASTRPIRRKLRMARRNVLKYYFPRLYADVLFEESFGHRINWKSPRDLNEWINYLAFKTDTSMWSKLADKFVVREYVAEKGLSHILVPLYGTYENADIIDFDTLPNSFVLKANHDSGSVIIVEDKSIMDKGWVCQKLNKSLSNNFGLETAEYHYLKIKPLIISEMIIPPPTNIDYKIWCFHGNPYCILVISDRDYNTGEHDFNVFDLEWNEHDEMLSEWCRNDKKIDKPQHLKEMIEYARILSQGFPQVRVDFYDTNDQIYFGEMTFTSFCGRMDYFTPDALKKMGEKVKESSWE